jgi:hypothetical protein
MGGICDKDATNFLAAGHGLIVWDQPKLFHSIPGDTLTKVQGSSPAHGNHLIQISNVGTRIGNTVRGQACYSSEESALHVTSDNRAHINLQ